MPFSLTFDSASRIVRLTFNGPAVPVEFESALVAITTAAEFPPDVDTVWDFSGADFSAVHSADIRRILEMRHAHAERGQGLIAVVVSTDVAFGMSRVFQALAEDAIAERLTVVRSVADAERWILERRVAG